MPLKNAFNVTVPGQKRCVLQAGPEMACQILIRKERRFEGSAQVMAFIKEFLQERQDRQGT